MQRIINKFRFSITPQIIPLGELDFLIDAFFIIAQKEYKILESNVSLRKKNLHCANRIFIVTRVNSHCANRIFKLFIRRNSLRKKNGQIWWSLRLLRIFVSLRKKNLSHRNHWSQEQTWGSLLILIRKFQSEQFSSYKFTLLGVFARIFFKAGLLKSYCRVRF